MYEKCRLGVIVAIVTQFDRPVLPLPHETEAVYQVLIAVHVYTAFKVLHFHYATEVRARFDVTPSREFVRTQAATGNPHRSTFDQNCPHRSGV
jgi:hypothetical protein